jgi:hypothetical protein
MKTRSITVAILVVLTASVTFAASDAQQSFQQLKSLSGSWEGIASNGKPVRVAFRVTSMGSALLSEIKGREDMITMFNLDGERLLLTHYCGTGNQPRMLATASPDGRTITFDFLDATNLAASDAGHMNRLVISLLGATHHTEAWSYVDHGKEMKEIFDLWREKK